MQIIIEVKNPRVFQRLLELLRVNEWLGGIKVWKRPMKLQPMKLSMIPCSQTQIQKIFPIWRGLEGLGRQRV